MLWKPAIKSIIIIVIIIAIIIVIIIIIITIIGDMAFLFALRH